MRKAPRASEASAAALWKGFGEPAETPDGREGLESRILSAARQA